MTEEEILKLKAGDVIEYEGEYSIVQQIIRGPDCLRMLDTLAVKVDEPCIVLTPHSYSSNAFEYIRRVTDEQLINSAHVRLGIARGQVNSARKEGTK